MVKSNKLFDGFSKLSLPNTAICIIGIIWLYSFLSIGKWEKQEVIQNDVISYYSYLPAAIIYNDLTFKFDQELTQDREIRIWTHEAPNGNRVQRMTMGLSFFYFPSFLLAHIYALLFDNPSGYSWPYEFMLSFGALVFATWALWYLSRVLLRYFSPIITSISIVAIALGTNLFYYVVVEGCMSHVYSFFLFSTFLFYFLAWNESPSAKRSVLLGLIFGLICLIRPSNALIIIVPVLFGVADVRSFVTRLTLAWNNKKYLLLATIMFAIVVSPQLIYWKLITGDWFYYSYNDESFFFLNPHIYEGLFSYRKGWLLYTPIMFFSLAGLLLLKSKLKNYLLPLSLFLAINIYVVFSWWCWWYGGSFGARALIETYAILAIPLAAFIGWILDNGRGIVLRGMLGLIMLGFIYLNLFQTQQYILSLLHWDSMNEKTYWAIFGRQTFPDNYGELIQSPDYQMALMGKEED